MSNEILHPLPSWRTVQAAQLAAVRLTIRPALIVMAALASGLCTFAGLYSFRSGEGINFVPEMASLSATAAALLPVAVWRGEYKFRHSYLASLPADRNRHVLTKMAAGWVWLMAAVSAYMLLLLILNLVTGGEIGVFQRVLASDVPPGASPEQAALLARRWTTPWWQWGVFFSSATVFYLFGSAVVLAGSRTRRWLGGIIAICSFAMLAEEQGVPMAGLADRVETLILFVFEGRYGLEILAAGSERPIETLGTDLALWRRPAAGLWVLTTLLWASLAAACVGLVLASPRKS